MRKGTQFSKIVKWGVFAATIVGIYLIIGLRLTGDALNPFGMSDLAVAEMQQEMESELDRYDQPDAALEAFASERLPANIEALSPAMYDAAMTQIDAMPTFNISTGQPSNGRAPLADAPWAELGPSNIGGRTRALLIDPNTPSTMYAAGVAGGVWKSTNSGSSWFLLNDYLDNMAVVSLAFDPADSSIIYAGTGEGVFNSDAIRGNGIFKTTNGGITWTHLANTANTADFHYVMDIVVSPNNSNHVYAATRTGVWKSTDAGVNWAQVVNHSGVNSRCTDLAIRTDTNPDTVFAACGAFTIQGAIYQTTDGTTWSSVFTEVNMGRTSLAIAPSNQSIIYALISSTAAGNYQYGLHKVIRSTTGGGSGTWSTRVANTDATKLNTVMLSNPVYTFLADCGFGTTAFLNQGWYDNVIAVDPLDSSRVWTGGIDLMLSTDGGQNWGLASYWWGGAGYVHADQHAIVFSPGYDGTTNQTMFVANDGGIHRTTIAASGTTSVDPCVPTNTFSWIALNNGYNVTQFYHGDTYPNGTTYFGGTQDNGTNRGTTGSTNWGSLLGGDGGYVAVNPSATTTLFAENTNLSIQKSTTGTGPFTSSISGITEASGNFLFINPFIMDPNNSNRLWTGGYTLWRTDDQATNWTQASVPNQTGGGGNSVTSWAVQPANSDLVLAGDEIGNIYRNASATTASSTTTWTDVANMGGYISSISFDPNTTSTAYATVSTFGTTHLWRSTDSGANWSAFGGALPDVPFLSVLVETGDSNRIYVGTDRGIFVTPDGGTSWYYALGFPRVPVEWMDLEFDAGIEYLYAFTHGRGALRAGTPIPTNVTLRSTIASGQATAVVFMRVVVVILLFGLATGALWTWRSRRQIQ